MVMLTRSHRGSVFCDSAHVGRLAGETDAMLKDRVLLHWAQMDADAVAQSGDERLMKAWLEADIAAYLAAVRPRRNAVTFIATVSR